jgi:hypothetical protein
MNELILKCHAATFDELLRELQKEIQFDEIDKPLYEERLKTYIDVLLGEGKLKEYKGFYCWFDHPFVGGIPNLIDKLAKGI